MMFRKELLAEVRRRGFVINMKEPMYKFRDFLRWHDAKKEKNEPITGCPNLENLTSLKVWKL